MLNKKLSKYNVEILSIGTEILLGDIVNTNSKWIAEELAKLGLDHFRQTTIGDNKYRISEIVKEISLRCNLLITTGGLGPTPDDLTTEAIANTFNTQIVERKYLLEEIKKKLSISKSNLNKSNIKKQCFFPADAAIINNSKGTAPGMIWNPKKNFTIMTFPGVPSELKSMWKDSAYEYIKKNFSNGEIFFSETIKFSGVSESTVAEKINYLLTLNNPTVAPYANLGELKLRITAKAKNRAEAKKIIKPIKEELKTKFGNFIFGEGKDNLPSVIIKELSKRNQSIVFAESCTGGLLSASLTSISGASEVFKGSIISYNNSMKERLLNVPHNLLLEYGAVSKQVAEAMATGVKKNLESDWAIAISGIAGPNGGTKDKPVGLVYIAIAGPENKIINFKKIFKVNRNRKEIQRLSVNECLNSLRLILLSIEK